MKRRIMALVAAMIISLSWFSKAPTQQPKAVAGGLAIGVSLGLLAFQLIGVATGKYDDVAEGMGCFIENGVEGWQKAFIGTENTPSWFTTGWNQIFSWCEEQFNAGNIEQLEDGRMKMSYLLYRQSLAELMSCAEFGVELVTDIEYNTISYPFGVPYYITEVSITNNFTNLQVGTSVIPFYFNDDNVYIMKEYYANCCYFKETYSSKDYYYLSNSIYQNNVFKGGYNVNCSDISWVSLAPYVQYNENTSFCCGNNKGTENSATLTDIIFTKITSENIVSDETIIPDGLSTGYIICNGKGNQLIQSITDFYVSQEEIATNDLSEELEDILNITDNPSLVLDPTNTDVLDGTTITDVNGVEDVTLKQISDGVKIKTDIDIPSLIINKFPFCIPFDFVKLITIFIAEPKEPVFVIPITSKETEYTDMIADSPMFENIDFNANKSFEIDEEIVIDLSIFPIIQIFSYVMFDVSFIALLLFITTKMIHH